MDPKIRELIERARKVSESATQGPWEWKPQRKCGYIPQGAYLGETLVTLGDTYEGSEHDCAFIAESRTLVPELAEALERAEADARRYRWLKQKNLSRSLTGSWLFPPIGILGRRAKCSDLSEAIDAEMAAHAELRALISPPTKEGK